MTNELPKNIVYSEKNIGFILYILEKKKLIISVSFKGINCL